MKDFLSLSIANLLNEYIFVYDFLDSYDLKLKDDELSKNFREFFDSLDEDKLEEKGLSIELLKEQFVNFMNAMTADVDTIEELESITIVGGVNKYGEPENVELTIRKGEIICIVGPTGSGKSRLLADIEWLAQKDTPTKRQILINGKVPDKKRRFSIDHKMVAQLSQNMNFVMDLTVEEFIRMHAESRLIENVDEKVSAIIAEANKLAGEQFQADTPVTSLSGGQSRALMIADTAILSRSPIILIDEIENAGIDRKKALELLVKEEKIVLMATHDPILALMGDKRLVIKNGGISKIIEVSEEERQHLPYLQALDEKLLSLRNQIRNGELLNI
ncbi:ATP-binding cassette domain-containing protein [Calditerrivibrio nitroreducens]|uniref:ABC transporter related protein n=1 Tax=Calditerrivibrio nitroreducens (strain DSM 19672 / NBRC 101217 / Yu37-1) TaxID=768670 RepID=E4TIB5_CALNY|nr:ABC transporter ATP-binding protein [Calditerrivibrio nitroreducens]ADR17940.1 ABC transporter related protein [Calditerrivibrio nitroreducens DSM 19672]